MNREVLAVRERSTMQHVATQTWYHYGQNPEMTLSFSTVAFVHLGTRRAAEERKWAVERDYGVVSSDALYEVTIAPRNPAGSLYSPLDDMDANLVENLEYALRFEYGGDLNHLLEEVNDPNTREFRWADFEGVIRRTGWDGNVDAIFYRNAVEHVGSVSVMVDQDAIRMVREL